MINIHSSQNENNDDNYNIYSVHKLKSLMDEKGYIHNDIVIRGDGIKSLGNLTKVYGNLGIDSNSLTDLGELNYVKNDFWITNSNNLKSLNNVETVGGNVTLRYSNITSLGNLRSVRGRFSIRDTEIKDIQNLKYVGELFLPKRFEGGDFDFIEIKKKIRFWNDVITKGNNELEDVGGENLSFGLDVNFENNSYSIHLHEWVIPTNPKDKYYKSKEEIESQNQKFQFYKDCVNSNQEFLNDFKDNYEIGKFYDRLMFEQLTLLKTKKNDEESFIETIYYYIKVFSIFNLHHFDFIDFLKLKRKYQLVYEIFSILKYSPSFSEVHELEIELKKRILFGNNLSCSSFYNLNEFIVKNINEFYDFINKKLDDVYEENYSFYYSLFGELKSVKEINDVFPNNFKINPYKSYRGHHLAAYYLLMCNIIRNNHSPD
jgi:hypothetical protein